MGVRGGLSGGAVLQWAPTSPKPLSKPLLPRPLPRPLPTSSSHLLRKCSTTSWRVQPTLGLLLTLPKLFRAHLPPLLCTGVSILLWRRSRSDPSRQKEQTWGGVEQEGAAEDSVDQRRLLFSQRLHP